MYLYCCEPESPYGDFRGFTELDCWKEARKLRIWSSELVKKLPLHEEKRLKDQIIRSSRSVSANIAEGYGRFGYKDSIRFYMMSRASISELIEHLIVAYDEQYIDSGELQKLTNQAETCFKLINGYIKYLNTKINKTTNPSTPE